MFRWIWGHGKTVETQNQRQLGEDFLALPLDTFAKSVGSIVAADTPASRAMFVVAYDNLRPLSGAAYSASTKAGEKPFVVEDFIKLFSEKLETRKDEIGQRRFTWFLVAAMLGRLDKLVRQNTELQDHAISCWSSLAESAPHLRALLSGNIVWKEEEKTWYRGLRTDADFVKHVLSHTMPAHYSEHPLIKQLATKHNFFLFRRETDLFAIV